jgi:hypothetical protein
MTRIPGHLGSRTCLLVALALLSAVPAAWGEDAPRNGVVSLVVENDLFYNVDRHYTNGIALLWVPGGDPPGWALSVARWLPWFPGEGRVHHGYAFGQNMYTPDDITVSHPRRDDRPYAGWLYATVGLGVETGRRLDQFAMTLGVVGPASLAERTQAFVHDVTGSEEPRGWDTQLEDEPGVLVTYQRSWRGVATERLAGLDIDLTPHVGGALGNVYTHASAGLTLRVGRSLALDYGPSRIQPGLPGAGFFVPPERFAWYVFAGVEGRAVARNIFLDGNTFRDSRSVDHEPLVADLQWGIAVTWRGARLSYTHVRRTREFESQDRRDQFGSVSLSLSF